MTERARPTRRARAHAALLSRIVVAGASASGMFAMVAVMGAAARPDGPELVPLAVVETTAAPPVPLPADPATTIVVPPLPEAAPPAAAPPPVDTSAPPPAATAAPPVPSETQPPAPAVTAAPPPPVPAETVPPDTAPPTTAAHGRTKKS
jgi:hypothetical protein